MPPSRGDTICGHVVIDALAPMQFGARAFGPVYLAHTPEEPRIWLTTIDRTLLPRTYDVSRFMAGVGELLHVTVEGAVEVVLVDREADFCVVGHRADPRARTLATLAESGANERLAIELAHALARTLAELHARDMVHGLVTPATVVRAGDRFQTWQHGIVKWCVPERLGQRLRPPGGDPIAPEVRAGAASSPASDVYAWAAAVACLLTGAVGSEAITLLELDAHDDPLRALVRRCLQPSPAMRPTDGAQLVARLDAIARLQPGAQIGWEVDSGEVSFADLFDDFEPAAATAQPVAAHPVPPRMPIIDTPSWRELAERYLADDAAKARQVAARAPEEIAASTSASELARVALVRARVRTGPTRPVRADPTATSGEWTISDDADPEPATPPPSDPNAPDLPSGLRVPELDEDGQALYAFPDPETGEIIVAGPHLRSTSHDDVVEREPGPDDTPRLVQLPKAPAERPRSRPRRAAPVAHPPASRRSAPTEPRATRGNRLVLALAGLGATVAVALAIWSANDAGGFSLFVDVPDHAEEATSAAVVGDARGASLACPSAMAPIAGLEVCIDRGEFPGEGQMPRTHVSFAEAERACTDRGLRLCAPDEWRRACRGRNDAAHPYGPASDPTRCNGADPGGQHALAASGARERCVSDAGVFDLEGNVAEWVQGGAALGGDATTRAPSCASRAQPGVDTRAPTLGFRCCLSTFDAPP
jgi:hypothetical protein